MKRILVCIDGSPRGPAVLAAATRLAEAHGGRLVLFRSVGLPPDVPQDFWKMTDESLLESLRHAAETYVAEQAKTVPPAVLDRTEVVIGVAWQAICETAKRDDCDLVVVGSHGYAGLDHLLGTTAAKVVNHAPCSVLVVRERPAR
ncbi:MAG TPA: universal stress protein [Polyangiaceae bacterium]|jgi:nucleotide-binding universal stress UspA family protein